MSSLKSASSFTEMSSPRPNQRKMSSKLSFSTLSPESPRSPRKKANSILLSSNESSNQESVTFKIKIERKSERKSTSSTSTLLSSNKKVEINYSKRKSQIEDVNIRKDYYGNYITKGQNKSHKITFLDEIGPNTFTQIVLINSIKNFYVEENIEAKSTCKCSCVIF